MAPTEGKQGQNDLEEEKLNKDLFKKLSEYMSAEVSASTHEYQLMGKLNLIVANRYKGMQEKAAKLNEFLRGLDEKCMCPTLAQFARFSPRVFLIL
eukprot:1394124-Amorphochlora_amoeboformis.AAC.1